MLRKSYVVVFLGVLALTGILRYARQSDTTETREHMSSMPVVDKFDPIQIAAFLDPIVEELMEVEHIPGAAISLVKDGKMIYSRGYGVADVESGRPVDPDRTIFRIGSITKAVTAMGLLRLVDQGKVKLDADVNSYLVDFKLEDRYAAPVTAWHLLTHTGGFDQIGINRNYDDPARRPSLGAFLKRDLRRIRTPGRETCYDTYGISLAGYLSEAVTGLGYGDYMRREVFEPLGMSRSYVEVPEAQRADLAIGYNYADGEYRSLNYEYYASLPASSIDATVSDMAKLMVALLGDGSNEHGRLFSVEMAARLREPQFRAHPDIDGFAWGFWEASWGRRRMLEHGGTMRGYASQMYLVPSDSLGIYVAVNRDSETGPRVNLPHTASIRLLDWWFGMPSDSPTPRKSEPLPIDTTRFAGHYIGNLYCHTCYDGQGWAPNTQAAVIESAGPGTIRLAGASYHAVEPLLFVRSDGQRKIAFSEDDKGRITGCARSVSSPGSTWEKVDERLVSEVAGEDWADGRVPPIAAVMYQVQERWSEAAAAYESADVEIPPDGLARVRALSRSALLFSRAGRHEDAVARFVGARQTAVKLAADNAALAPGIVQALREMTLKELASRAALGDGNGAFDLIEFIVGELGIPASAVVSELTESPRFKHLVDDARFASLQQRGLKGDPVGSP